MSKPEPSAMNRWEVFRKAEYGCHDCGGRLAVKKNGKVASRCLRHLTENRELRRRQLGCKRRYDNATLVEGEPSGKERSN